MNFAGSAPTTVRTSPEQGVAGLPFGSTPLGDAVLSVELTLLEGDDNDQFGVYVRQSTPERYMALTLSISGRCLVIEKDAQVIARIDGPLAPDVPFSHGTGATNMVSVVLAGPALVLYVNHAPIVPVPVDARFLDGVAGYYLRPGGTSPSVVLEAGEPRVTPLVV